MAATPMMDGPLRPLVLAIGLGSAYAIGSLLSFWLFGASDIGVAYFPPAGVSAAALLLLPRRDWPWALGAFAVAEVAVDAGQGYALWRALGFALANGLEPLVGASALRSVVPVLDLRRRRDLAWFTVTMLGLGPLVGGLVGSAFLVRSQGYLSDVFHWWIGDSLAVLTIGAPVIVLARRGAWADLRSPLEGIVLGAATLLVGTLLLWQTEQPVVFLIGPLLLGAAFRYGPTGLALTGAITAVVANVATATGNGPFAAQPGFTAQEQLGLTQLFLAVVLLSSWFFAVEIHERDTARQGEAKEREARDEAELSASAARAVALTLQHDLLPSRLLARPNVVIGARYEPGTQGLDIGGDWYETLDMGGGRVGAVIGDVVGRGLPAATTMGRLRTAIAAFAADGGRPGEVLDRLDRFVDHIEGADCASCCFVVLDPATGSLQVASAGHPPPLVRRPDGSTRFLEGGRSGLLGTGRPPRPTHAETLGEGEALVLYTDGLVERRGEDLDTGLARLAAATAALDPSDPMALSDELVRRLAPPEGLPDDAAVLCLLRTGRLRHTFPARPQELRPVRRLLRSWLDTDGMPAAMIDDVLVAVGEACSNAVEHSGTAEVEVVGHRSDGQVVVVVRDRGRWRTPPAITDRGRGSAIMERLTDRLERHTDAEGTTLVLTFAWSPEADGT